MFEEHTKGTYKYLYAFGADQIIYIENIMGYMCICGLIVLRVLKRLLV